ncbi:SNF2-related protein [Candidatus Synechococcus calcipolaris G9]|uniref:SNF2-related protein n=1 Tax=Candidatus Synechococcus calcipolaris G9 TaxID=1497997 RepID=A0ABT6F2A8_9SYNE|nr:SNF2-related protein [Candidatus Synechococcus calcipolaris]MDG2991992.1 SNF2-related protein [Candidatus Synechococcus calcipolaris G9]
MNSVNSLKYYSWKTKYSRDSGDILQEFYIPALTFATRYWRTTGYFSATALALAMRGLEGLIQNQGTMRLIVGCTLNAPEIEAIQKGEDLRQRIQTYLLAQPLILPNQAAHDALELLAWLIQHHILDIKIAIPCDAHRQPSFAPHVFHEKAGIIEDKDGERIAFTGSINETENGWLHNWESFHVFTSWATPDHVNAEDESFASLWADRSPNALVMTVPQAIHDHLLQFAPPANTLPKRLVQSTSGTYTVTPSISPAKPPEPDPILDSRTIVWNYIAQAPHLPGGERIGEVTSAVTPWPHQIRAFKRMWDNWPPKLLIADEVGLGKTIQAGLILRQAWLSGKAKRILIMAPAAVLKQWQIELREKFNLNWPTYDGKNFNWYPSVGLQHSDTRPISRQDWHKEPCLIVSSHLMRRADRMPELLHQAEQWDLIILDEAHAARRQGQQTNLEKQRPNRLLALMQQLRNRTQGLVLLTATPMQIHPIEVWDLLSLLGLPSEWTAADFLRFFELTNKPSPSSEELAYMARLFRSVEHHFTEINEGLAQKLAPQTHNRSKTKRILKALRNTATTPLRQLETDERAAAIRIMQAHSPVRVLISRHTRDLLRSYYNSGKISTPISQRHVKDEFIPLSPREREVYEAVENYITTTYNNAAAAERNAVGFVMTIYRRRLASSFYALAQTLKHRLEKLQGNSTTPVLVETLAEDIFDEDINDEAPDIDEAQQLEIQALEKEEATDLQDLLNQVSALPIDSKTEVVKQLIKNLQSDGYQQIIIFTQFTDTLDFLRQELTQSLQLPIICFSGRGGEILQNNGYWKVISREQTKQRFLNGQADLMLCTEAAAEGLNFQFCGALINYDMPWNPMKVEQRIGRIDRIGQKHREIRIHNLHYANTVEADVYQALQERIEAFQDVVGRLQPILARLPNQISRLVLQSKEQRERYKANLMDEIKHDQSQISNFDLDAIIDQDFISPALPEPAYTLTDLQNILTQPNLLPAGISATSTGTKDFSYLRPGMNHSIRVTTDPTYYDQNSDSVELWSPGSPLFPQAVSHQNNQNQNKIQFQNAISLNRKN